MNRLVIVGNGFDLAHGLPTGYCDFINSYWKSIIENVELFKNESLKQSEYEDDFITIQFRFGISYLEQIDPIKNEFRTLNLYEDLKKFISKYKITLSGRSQLQRNPNFPINDCKLNFKNSFFKKITETKSIQNWVDIENEYYKILKDCLKEDGNNSRVKKLNEEFENVKKLLENYLFEEVIDKYDCSVHSNEILDILKKKDILEEELVAFYKELQNEDSLEIKKFIIKTKTSFEGNPKITYSLSGLHFLTFNYTPLVQNYVDQLNNEKFISNYIHGKLRDLNNPINFGFGDEMDNKYQEIEEKDDNEYLKNIKSFAYLNVPNYKELLDLIHSEKFQVYIMGHSCGLSDRTLLNVIFEHENCRSIKIFYHEYVDKATNKKKDNYTEIVQNISRHFNKKKLMREKIVNKTLCQPLPQIELPLKENGSQS